MIFVLLKTRMKGNERIKIIHSSNGKNSDEFIRRDYYTTIVTFCVIVQYQCFCSNFITDALAITVNCVSKPAWGKIITLFIS